MTTFLAAACVTLLVLLICGGLAAYDLITQLDEDVETAVTDRDDYKQRLEQMSAKNLALQVENTDLSFALDALLDPADEQPARHLRSVDTAANVIDLIAHNEATRDLNHIDTWLDGWATEGDEPA